MLSLRINPVPAPQVRKQAQRDRNRWLPLIGFRAALLPTVVASAFQVDVRASERRDGRCGCDGSRARSAVDSQQNKASKMSERTLACRCLHILHWPTRLLLHFAIPPTGPDQLGRIAARQPFVARLAFLWQRDLDNFPMISFGSVMTNRGAKILKVSASSAFLAALLGIGATCFAVDVAEHFRAPPVIQSLYPLLKLADGRNGLIAFAINVETTS